MSADQRPLFSDVRGVVMTTVVMTSQAMTPVKGES